MKHLLLILILFLSFFTSVHALEDSVNISATVLERPHGGNVLFPLSFIQNPSKEIEEKDLESKSTSDSVLESKNLLEIDKENQTFFEKFKKLPKLFLDDLEQEKKTPTLFPYLIIDSSLPIHTQKKINWSNVFIFLILLFILFLVILKIIKKYFYKKRVNQ